MQSAGTGSTEPLALHETRGARNSTIYTAGGLIGAVLASTCCIVPLALVVLGVSGLWIGSLTALTPYKPVFAAVSLAFLAGGFWQVYIRAPRACAEGSYCARPGSSTITKAVLWIATALVMASMTIGWWAPLFY